MNPEKGEVLAFNKPYRWTSFNVVAKVRRELSGRIGVKKLKVGHAGTLDPLATGVLLVCTGKATKRIDELQAHTKEYVATIKLGATTPSFDMETAEDATYPTEHITREMVEETLKKFQNNDLLRPTILTTSQKLSTGVDARNVRNIVLLRPVNNMIEFKQILGRGTRLFDGKYFFTLYDFVGASERFKDKDWDGDPFCEVCGNYPCTCNRTPKGVCPHCGNDPCTCPPPLPPEPCPVCGNLPCTCPGPKRNKIVVKLSPLRSLCLETRWDDRIMFGNEVLTIDEYIKKLFGALPQFLDGEEDLRQRWSSPDTRQQLLDVLERSGFPEDKLEQMRRILQLEQCDMLDVLAFLAYETTPIERQRRAEILREDMLKELSKQQQEFIDFILDMYVRNGFKELGMEKLATLIDMKYHTIADAKQQLNLDVKGMRDLFLGMQKELYNGKGVVNVTIENHYHGQIDNLTINE